MTTVLLHPRSGVPYSELKAKARAMRAEHHSLEAIAAALDISRDTVRKWTADISCNPARHPRSGILYAELKAKARAMRTDGASIRKIAEALDVTDPGVLNWVRDMPCHRELTKANARKFYESRRIYPRGYSADGARLRQAGYSREERVRMVAEMARAGL
ncbi:hypothetical protein [Methylobacterium iners]|uniref:Transposase n=1 Tax=Methylobacterium iners TaxID=418707 RepID=A0ABQ4RTK3_9HYPH|nr:hypothetical protein [Methylobacterium iners]GJD92880.1 hypothetical protein OCOJLMKI_0063 [Methylobacterium iners]